MNMKIIIFIELLILVLTFNFLITDVTYGSFYALLIILIISIINTVYYMFNKLIPFNRKIKFDDYIKILAKFFFLTILQISLLYLLFVLTCIGTFIKLEMH